MEDKSIQHCNPKALKKRAFALSQSMTVALGCLAVLLVGSAFERPIEPAMTVVIDAGHGGKDPGNLGTGRYKTAEKDITLAVAQKTAAYIQERIPEVKVIMTRTGDTYPTVPGRVKIANEANADLLLSIHCDSFKKSSASGSSSFVMGLDISEESLRIEQKENAALFEDAPEDTKGFDPDDPDTFIALALKQQIYLDKSLELADLVQTQFRDRVGRKDRGVRQARYYVTAYANMPSVLVELGFLTNPTEEDFLRSEQGQDYMASALFRAFRSYAQHWFSLNSAMDTDFPLPLEGEPESPSPDPSVEVSIAQDVPAWHQEITGDCTASVCFSVQAASNRSGETLKDNQGHEIPEVVQQTIGNVYKYRVGATPSYAKACRMRDNLRENGFPDAFVLAFEADQRIPLQDALKKAGN